MAAKASKDKRVSLHAGNIDSDEEQRVESY